MSLCLMELVAGRGHGLLFKTTADAPSATSLCHHLGLAHSARFSNSSGFSNVRLGRATNKYTRLTRRMADLRSEAAEGPAMGAVENHGQAVKTRKVVDHCVLFKMMDSLGEVQEKDMLDSLWSLQFQIKNIIATSVGRIPEKTPEGYTHGLFTRFTTKEACAEYMEHPIRWKLARELVLPFYQGLVMVDFEADVEDDLDAIFRRSSEYKVGVEHFLMLKFRDGTTQEVVDEYLQTAIALAKKFGDIVQLTIGSNFSPQSIAYISHGLVARLPSEESLEDYQKFLQSEPSWTKLQEHVETAISAHYPVGPIGEALM